MIAPFGGAKEVGEYSLTAATRELFEEIEIEVKEEDLEHIGVFSSDIRPKILIDMYVLELDVDLLDKIVVHEGKGVVAAERANLLESDQVTDFTKDILATL